MFRVAAEIIAIVLFISFLIWIMVALIKGIVNMYYGKNSDNNQEIEELKNQLLEKDKEIEKLKNRCNSLNDELIELKYPDTDKVVRKPSSRKTTRKAD